MSAHVHPAFRSILAGIESAAVAAVRAQRMRDYTEKLAAHDWQAYFSDDPRAYKQEQLERAELMLMRAELDLDGSIWNSLAPTEFHVGVRA